MKLINVRKGQFVYYENMLHKVYSVKPFFKKSVHIARLNDLEQNLVTAREIEYYRPQHMDSFTFHHERFTLQKDIPAKVGDYILVINPRPDSLDHHHLHAIEVVSSLEDNGVISDKSNGIKHNEYWVMTPGLLDGANVIDQLVPDEQDEPMSKQQDKSIQLEKEIMTPKIGDIYQKNDADPIFQAMVVAIDGRTIHLGGNITVQTETLMNTDTWTFIINMYE